MRVASVGLRLVILAGFTVFFIAPVIWLILAPTKGDNALVTSSPFSFGSFHEVSLAWRHLNAFSDHIYRQWILNTLYYALTATAITLVVSVPAGYGLALGPVFGLASGVAHGITLAWEFSRASRHLPKPGFWYRRR